MMSIIEAKQISLAREKERVFLIFEVGSDTVRAELPNPVLVGREIIRMGNEAAAVATEAQAFRRSIRARRP